MGELLTLKQVAEHLHVSIDSVRMWTRNGFRGVLLRTTLAGRRKLVKPEWINQFQLDCEQRRTNKLTKAPKARTRKDNAHTTKRLRRHGLKG